MLREDTLDPAVTLYLKVIKMKGGDSMKFDPEIGRPLKAAIDGVDTLRSVGVGPFHAQGELVAKTGMPELQKNTEVLVEAAEVFFGKTLQDYCEALDKMARNQQQVKDALGIED